MSKDKAISSITEQSNDGYYISFMSRCDKSEMSVEAFYGLYAHFQLVSGFTNSKGETFRKKSYICWH